MRKLLTFIFLTIALLGVFMNLAEAARFGGGRSFGAQRSFSSFSRQAQPTRAFQTNNARPRSSWIAPLAGLAMGGLLGYLMMGHGLGSGLLSWLVLLGLALLVWNFISNKLRAATAQGHQAGRGRIFDAQSHFNSSREEFNRYDNDREHYSSMPSYPTGFDSEGFLRDAKVQFMRLQTAFDRKDLKDLREFTAPEVFAEIQMQLQERGEKENHTEVVSLNADLLDVSHENQEQLATVKFSGVIREGREAASQFFEEAWHFRQDRQGKWRVAGVQQNLY